MSGRPSRQGLRRPPEASSIQAVASQMDTSVRWSVRAQTVHRYEREGVPCQHRVPGSARHRTNVRRATVRKCGAAMPAP